MGQTGDFEDNPTKKQHFAGRGPGKGRKIEMGENFEIQ